MNTPHELEPRNTLHEQAPLPRQELPDTDPRGSVEVNKAVNTARGHFKDHGPAPDRLPLQASPVPRPFHHRSTVTQLYYWTCTPVYKLLGENHAM